MADLSILDQSAAKIMALTIDPADVPELLAAETAGKTRKGVSAWLEALLPPPVALAAPDEPETGAGVDFSGYVDTDPPIARSDGCVEIECIIPNVHLGDGRQLNLGERDFVNPVLAALLVGNGQAAYV